MATAPILEAIDEFGEAVFYSKRYRQMLEDHLTLLQGMKNDVRQITQNDWATLNRYVGDFYGFLTAIGIPRKYQWTVMRLNGFRSRFDLDLTLTSLQTPDYAYISKLGQLSKEKRA